MKRVWQFIGFGVLGLFLTACQQQRAAYTVLEQMMNGTVAADGAGVVLYVNSPEAGEQLFARGLADREAGTAVRTVSHYRLAGLTKPFISTLVMQMITEGELSFADTVAERLPMLADDIPYSDQITIRDLLMMTSGIPDYRDNPDFWTAVLAQEKRGWHPRELLVYAFAQSPVSEPGVFHYSNSNYLLLQLILADVLEDPLLEALQDRILDPLDMQDTFLEPTESTTGGHISGYSDIDGDGMLDSWLPYDDGRGLGDLGMISSAANLGRFAPALYQRTLPGADGRSLSLATADMGNGDGYGLGIMRRDSAWGDMWGYDTTSSGFSNQMWYLPDYDVTLVVLVNAEQPELTTQVVEATLTTLLNNN